MEIHYLKSVDSTQKYLKRSLKEKTLFPPIAVTSDIQTNGVGSRNNSWTGVNGNFFLSFAIDKKDLPKDLPLVSASIYFSFLLKEVLKKEGSSVFIKWPNDFYLSRKKIGGTITEVVGNTLICGIGLNLQPVSKDYGHLDIQVDKNEIMTSFLNLMDNPPSWQEIFSKFKVEFYKNRELNTHHNDMIVSLKDVLLNDDGSLIIEGKRILSLR
ncbi:MAG: biotin--[acetyl-CoA-carboxylase] ligase [Campylobacterales bacterium]|nr:biotin--[acetyl-CoA-carboxylase] ligase [Campylobacterales bacterium]